MVTEQGPSGAAQRHECQPGAAAPLDRGPIFHIRVMNRRHRVSVSFDERSRGFVWFFSFLAYFSELEETNTNDLVLLLDEPGLALHATAQNDLLRYMEEKLAPEHQVIYTTHSPFMIYSEHLNGRAPWWTSTTMARITSARALPRR